MTFNVCIKKHFDEAFGPYGFKKIKSKYPYWGRMVGDEILQIITYKNEWSIKPYKDFSIWGGVATVYRQKIDLDISPRDQNWLVEVREMLKLKQVDFRKKQEEAKYSDNTYHIDNDKEMETKIQNALNMCISYLLPEITKADTITNCYQFFREHTTLLNISEFKRIDEFSDENEGIILFDLLEVNDYFEMKNMIFERNNIDLLNRYKKNAGDDYLEVYRNIYEKRKKRMEESIEIFRYVKSNSEIQGKIKNLKETRKLKNVEYLINKGLITRG